MPTTRTATDMPDLRSLSARAKALNEKTDELGQSLQKLQDGINEMQIGLEVWLDEPISTGHWSQILDSREDPTGSRQRDITQIGYGRLGDTWGIVVRDGQEVETPDPYSPNSPDYEYQNFGNASPLLRSRRATRLKALPFLQKLVNAIDAAVAEATEHVESTKALADITTDE